MKNKNIDNGLITESEYSDFVNLIKKFKLKEDDFEIKADRNDIVHENGINYTPSGVITITFTLTKKSKKYKGGHGSTWVADFHNDWNKKYFL